MTAFGKGLLFLTSILITLTAAELTLRHLGFGRPILYYSTPLYGYRPIPNQNVVRFNSTSIKINNLGLRSDSDWNSGIEDKALFLGDSVLYGGSYISNEELFSTIAFKNIKGFMAGNAGVNGWGVENIYGLIVEREFLPAKIYITVLTEANFYRGITRLQGLPFWACKPRFALEELLHYFYYKQLITQYRPNGSFSDALGQKKTAERAAIKLQQMDEFLKKKGLFHLVYITPSLAQTLGKEPKDEFVMHLLQEHHIKPVYLLDKINSIGLNREDRSALYHDTIHLSKKGHAQWGELISHDLNKLLVKDPEKH